MVDIQPLDISELLDNEKTIAEYLRLAADDPNPDVFIGAIADVAKARGMAFVAQKAGLGRESLYQALAPGANPSYTTLRNVLDALNVKMEIAVCDA